MKKFSIVFLMCCLACLSCKKKSNAIEQENPAPNTSSNGYSGILTTGNYTTIISGISFTSSSARAYFTNQPGLAFDALKSIPVASVRLNSDSLTFSPSLKYYTIQSNTLVTSETWSVTGTNELPSFSHENTFAYPLLEPFLMLPDSISKSTGVTINLRVDLITSGSLLLVNGNAVASALFSVVLNKGDNSIHISATDLDKFVPGADARLVILLENAEVAGIASENFKFVRERQLSKAVRIVW